MDRPGNFGRVQVLINGLRIGSRSMIGLDRSQSMAGVIADLVACVHLLYLTLYQP